jgi:hypothetical protein
MPNQLGSLIRTLQKKKSPKTEDDGMSFKELQRALPDISERALHALLQEAFDKGQLACKRGWRPCIDGSNRKVPTYRIKEKKK